jgi:hypothetical protein
MRLSQNFSFGKVTLDLEAETAHLAVSARVIPKTNRVLGIAQISRDFLNISWKELDGSSYANPTRSTQPYRTTTCPS